MIHVFDVYIAIPYSHDSEEIKKIRYDKATEYLAELSRERVIAFSPITHSHPMGEYNLPTTWGFWSEFDIRILKGCKELHVIMMPGWETSTGVTAEIAAAKKMGSNIVYIDPDTLKPIET